MWIFQCLAVIDEQHKFGVHQRAMLRKQIAALPCHDGHADTATLT
jgi:RecG-like helicase